MTWCCALCFLFELKVVLRGKDAVALHAMSVQTGCVLHGKELGCTRPVCPCMPDLVPSP